MSNRTRFSNFRVSSVALMLIIGAASLTFVANSASAAEVSFFDSLKGFFGLRDLISGPDDKQESPNTAFTPGNLVAIQIGDGNPIGTGVSEPIVLIEYTTAGAPIQTILVPSTGASPRLTVQGSSAEEGHLVRSSDGWYLTFTGYDVAAGAPQGTYILPSTPRTIGRIGSDGVLDLTTAYTDGSIGAVRSAASTNGTNIWTTNSQVGLRFKTFGSSGTSTQVASVPTNFRVVKIFNGQLYMTAGSTSFSCVSTVGTGTPTTTSTVTPLPGMNCSGAASPYSFSISPDGNTMYVADDGLASANGGIQKWTKSGGIWSNPYTLLNNGVTNTPVRGLTTDWSGADPIIYATTFTLPSGSVNTVIKVVDTGAGSTATTLATSATNTHYRGIDFTPISLNSTPTPTNTATDTPTATSTNTPANTATNTPTPTATAAFTPTFTPTPGGSSISGTITYGNAIGNPVPPRFVKNVSCASTVGSPAVGPVITGTPGSYTLTGFGAGGYTIQCTKSGGPNASISSNDAARVAQGVTGSVPFVSQNQRFSADTSGNGGVSSNDAALIARFAAGLTGFGNTGQWRFFVTGAPSPLPTAPQTYNDSRSYTSVSENLTGEDYVALLVGEASGNYNPATHPRPALGPERSTSVTAPRLVTPADNEVVIPISVTGAADKAIVSYEFNLRYDPSVIQPQANPVEVAGTVSRGLTAVANPNEPGLLRVVLYGAYPINKNGLLLNLRFNAVGAPGSTSPLTFERMMFNEGDPGTLVTDGSVWLTAAAEN